MADLVGVIRSANGARVAFGELRYWLTDLAVSLLILSERTRRQLGSRMERHLDQLAARKPDRIATVRVELAQFRNSRLTPLRNILLIAESSAIRCWPRHDSTVVSSTSSRRRL